MRRSEGQWPQPTLLKGLLLIVWTSFIFVIVNWSQAKSIASDGHRVAVRMKWIAEEVIPPKLLQSSLLSSKAGDKYIERPALKSQLDYAMSADIDGYWIVYGPKGEGKSEIVEHNAINRSAVVKVVVSNAGTKEEVIASIMTKLTVEGGYNLDIDALKSVLKTCKSKGFTPLIIYEIERDKVAHQGAIVAAKGLAKALTGYCRSILVLSEANAVLEFTEDKARERFIFIGEMTRHEASKLLKSRGAKFNKEEMTYVFDNIGTVPQRLIQLIEKVYSENMSLAEYVNGVLDDAMDDLVQFPLKPILKALKENPDGVSPISFGNEKYAWNSGLATVTADLSKPRTVALAMKNQDCILYRMELRMYQLQSTAHKTALKNYNPVM